MPVVREDGLEVRQATLDAGANGRWEHPFPRTGRVLHAPGQDNPAVAGRQATTVHFTSANAAETRDRMGSHAFSAERPDMFVFARAVTYSTLFIGFVLIFLPARVLSRSGVVAPAAIGPWQNAGMLVAAAGAALAVSCIVTFALVGKGTPAPFDPPRRLVVRGPYRFVRNPMYIGAGLAMAGAALYYQSFALFGYIVLFFLVTHLFVAVYEEPTLRRTFGNDYTSYCNEVGRWWPRRASRRLRSA